MISFDEALERVRGAAHPLGTETVAIDAAAGRVLAAPAIARIASPRRDVSAMDGYAVREADLSTLPAKLKIVGDSFAGGGWNGAFESPERAATTSSRVNQRASSSSLVSTISESSGASAQAPIISELGKGQGWLVR